MDFILTLFLPLRIFLVNIVSVIIGLVGITFVVLFHELGHFLFCKLFGVGVRTFSVGYGPAICRVYLGGTEFRLSVVPIGGYVEIMGENQDEETETDKAHPSSELEDKPYYQKMFITFGGILFNFILAILLMTITFRIGLKDSSILSEANILPIVASVKAESPAEAAGIVKESTVTAIGSERINQENFGTTLSSKLAETAGSDEIVPIEFQLPDGRNITLTSRTLGIGWKQKPIAPVGWLKAFQKGIKETINYGKRLMNKLIALFQTRSPQPVGGFIMMIFTASKMAERGITALLILLAVTSISLAIVNLLPLPILDGGQSLIYTSEVIFRRATPSKIRDAINYVSWGVILVLTVYLAIRDIIQIFFR